MCAHLQAVFRLPRTLRAQSLQHWAVGRGEPHLAPPPAACAWAGAARTAGGPPSPAPGFSSGGRPAGSWQEAEFPLNGSREGTLRMTSYRSRWGVRAPRDQAGGGGGLKVLPERGEEGAAIEDEGGEMPPPSFVPPPVSRFCRPLVSPAGSRPAWSPRARRGQLLRAHRDPERQTRASRVAESQLRRADACGRILVLSLQSYVT